MARADLSLTVDHELPTWLLIGTVYGGWVALTLAFNHMPAPLGCALGALLICLHGSVQHEIIHGHPSRNARLNNLLAYPPLGLVYPYPIYRDSHLTHHRVKTLTDPVSDPESYYFEEEVWNRMGSFRQSLFLFNNTLAGRLLLGPALCMIHFYRQQAKSLLQGDHRYLPVWLLHGLLCFLLFFWTTKVCAIPPAVYIFGIVYPGLSLTLLRSFAEHKPGDNNDERSVIVEAALPFRVLFLNNNYHWVHHDQPSLPWYTLPAYYRERKESVLAANGGYLFRGYLEIARRYMFKPKDKPVLPGS